MEKVLKVANELPGSPHTTKAQFITNSFKSEVFDGAVSDLQYFICG